MLTSRHSARVGDAGATGASTGLAVLRVDLLLRVRTERTAVAAFLPTFYMVCIRHFTWI